MEVAELEQDFYKTRPWWNENGPASGPCKGRIPIGASLGANGFNVGTFGAHFSAIDQQNKRCLLTLTSSHVVLNGDSLAKSGIAIETPAPDDFAVLHSWHQNEARRLQNMLDRYNKSRAEGEQVPQEDVDRCRKQLEESLAGEEELVKYQKQLGNIHSASVERKSLSSYPLDWVLVESSFEDIFDEDLRFKQGMLICLLGDVLESLQACRV